MSDHEDDIGRMSTEEMLAVASSWGNAKHPKWEILKTVLPARVGLDQARAARALNRVTWALFAMAAVQAALIVVQILVSLKVIGA